MSEARVSIHVSFCVTGRGQSIFMYIQLFARISIFDSSSQLLQKILFQVEKITRSKCITNDSIMCVGILVVLTVVKLERHRSIYQLQISSFDSVVCLRVWKKKSPLWSIFVNQYTHPEVVVLCVVYWIEAWKYFPLQIFLRLARDAATTMHVLQLDPMVLQTISNDLAGHLRDSDFDLDFIPEIKLYLVPLFSLRMYIHQSAHCKVVLPKILDI